MASVHLQNDRFMTELTLMFHNARSAGHISLTIKRYDGRNKPYPKERKVKGAVVKPVAPLPEPDEYFCLIRAKDKKKKISTVVSSANVLKFQMQFAHFLKSSMDGLKKEKKPKKVKKTAG